MLVEKLKERFAMNEPFFTNEILQVMQDYSRPRVYQMIAEAEKSGELARYASGTYYLPKETEFGPSVPSIDDVIRRKYISDHEEVFGIYGKYVIDLNFLVSSQVPNTIEVITNRESRKVREVEIRGRRVVLRKSRVPITKENASAYTLMELFSNMDMRQYQEEKQIRDCVLEYVREEKITREGIFSLADAFPARTMKNIATSGVLYAIAP